MDAISLRTYFFEEYKSMNDDINYLWAISTQNVEKQADVGDVIFRMQASSVSWNNFAKWLLSNRVEHVLWFTRVHKQSAW